MRTKIKICPKCSAEVPENWLKRHLRSDCKRGQKRVIGDTRRKFSWDYRPANGSVVVVQNRYTGEWERMTYWMENGGTLEAEDGWRGRVDRFRKTLYPKWSER